MAEGASFKTKELVGAVDCRLLQPGHWALLWFEGDNVWHKRLLLYPASRDKSHWICVTPDEDIYEEALCETDPENWAIRSFGLRDFADSPQERRQGIYDFDGTPSLDQVKE